MTIPCHNKPHIEVNQAVLNDHIAETSNLPSSSAELNNMIAEMSAGLNLVKDALKNLRVGGGRRS